MLTKISLSTREINFIFVISKVVMSPVKADFRLGNNNNNNNNNIGSDRIEMERKGLRYQFSVPV